MCSYLLYTVSNRLNIVVCVQAVYYTSLLTISSNSTVATHKSTARGSKCNTSINLLYKLSVLAKKFVKSYVLCLCRPNAFAVITPSRVFNLISESSAEMHMWIGGTCICEGLCTTEWYTQTKSCTLQKCFVLILVCIIPKPHMHAPEVIKH